MTRDTRVKDLRLLPKFRDRLSFLYAEHVKIDKHENAIALHDLEGMTPVPVAALAVLMLGPGSSVTHSAVGVLAENNCLVVWCGEENVRFYACGMGGTRSAERLILQARLASNEQTRLQVVRRMYCMRFLEDIPEDLTVEQLRGMEGSRVRTANGKDSRMQSKQHKYHISAKHSENSVAMERLFICTKGSKSAQADDCRHVAVASLAANCHTSIPVDVAMVAGMSTSAIDLNPNAGDPQFSFIMCRAGTNKNGDHFLPDELSTRYTTAINKKIDLKHSQDLTDIVGGIVNAEFVDDETGGRVECVGELFTADTPTAALAHKLMKRGIITQNRSNRSATSSYQSRAHPLSGTSKNKR